MTAEMIDVETTDMPVGTGDAAPSMTIGPVTAGVGRQPRMGGIGTETGTAINTGDRA